MIAIALSVVACVISFALLTLDRNERQSRELGEWVLARFDGDEDAARSIIATLAPPTNTDRELAHLGRTVMEYVGGEESDVDAVRRSIRLVGDREQRRHLTVVPEDPA